MADVRISALPNEAAPSGSDFVPIDLATTRKTTVTLLTEAGRPAASQAEAEAGVQATHAMTPLTTKQAITFQVGAGFQPLDADLTAIAALATNGIATRTAANTWTTRTITGTANQVTVTNGDGVAGNPTISLAGATGSLSGLSLIAGDLLYATGSNTLARIALGSINQVLQVFGGVPTWRNVPGTGDVVGPASSVANSIASFSGTTGKILFDSGVTATGGALTTTAAATIGGQLIISGASAGQIVFPATQNPSANVNTLDDYEEGTWTPTVVPGGGTITTLGAVSGTYVKIGRVVNFAVSIAITTNGTGSGSVRVTNLPFTIGVSGCGCGRANNVSGKLLQGDLGASSTDLSIFNFDGTYPGASGEVLRVSGTYFV